MSNGNWYRASVWREDKTYQLSPAQGRALTFFEKTALSQSLLRTGRPPLTYLPLSCPFIGREGEKKGGRVGLEKNEHRCQEMKEEGREPSKFPVFSLLHPPGGDPGGGVNSACLLLINPRPALYGVVFRAVLGSQEHFREQSFTQEKRNKAGTVPLKQRTGNRTHWIFFLVYCLDLLPARAVDKYQTSRLRVLYTFLPPLWLCPWHEVGPWALIQSI